MANVTLEHAHRNMLLKTYHLIHDENEIVSITQVFVKATDKDGYPTQISMYDVLYINGVRARLDPKSVRVETIRK